MPSASRCTSASCRNSVVTTTAVGRPSASSAIPSCVQHDVHDPQSPIAVRTMSFSAAISRDQRRLGRFREAFLAVVVDRGESVPLAEPRRRLAQQPVGVPLGVVEDAEPQPSSAATRGAGATRSASTRPRGSKTDFVCFAHRPLLSSQIARAVDADRRRALPLRPSMLRSTGDGHMAPAGDKGREPAGGAADHEQVDVVRARHDRDARRRARACTSAAGCGCRSGRSGGRRRARGTGSRRSCAGSCARRAGSSPCRRWCGRAPGRSRPRNGRTTPRCCWRSCSSPSRCCRGCPRGRRRRGW